MRVPISILAVFGVMAFGTVPPISAEIPDEVVRLSVQASPAVRPGETVDAFLTVEIADGWHINAHTPSEKQFIPTVLTVDAPAGITVVDIQYPDPIHKKVSFIETPLELYEGKINIKLILRVGENFSGRVGVGDAASADVSDIGPATLTVRLAYQACDDEKCLPPRAVSMDISFPAPVKNNFIGFGAEDRGGRTGRFAADFENKGFLLTLAAIFWAGVLLNLTPCVYPMIPITMAYFGGRGVGATRSRGGAVAYFLGIVITYSVLGTAAGLTGGLFGAVLQHPAVLIALTALMLYMACGMFGWVPFQMPQSLVDRVGTGRIPLGAFGLGATMGVVAAPCIGPFVVGLLAYVGSQKSAVLGFSLFSILAAGLGLPYLLLGLFSSRISRLPKLGEWMDAVKCIFGFALIGMAVHFAAPLIPENVQTGLYAVVLCAAAVTAIYSAIGKGKWPLAAAFVFAAGLFGAAYWMLMPAQTPAADEFWLPYDAESFNMAVSAGNPILLDFYAEWCAPCKKLDRVTYADSRVRSAFEKAVRLKADLTLYDTPESMEARERFGVSGVPTTIYIDRGGRERLRYEGFVPPDVLLADFSKLGSAAPRPQVPASPAPAES